MAKFKYSPDVDILAVEFSDGKIDYAEEHGPLILHYTREGKLVSMEILDAREFLFDALQAMIKKREPELVSTDG